MGSMASSVGNMLGSIPGAGSLGSLAQMGIGAATGNPMLALMGGSQLLGGVSADSAANQQAQAQRQRYAQQMGMDQSLMHIGQSPWSTGTQQLAQNYQMPSAYAPGQYNAGQFNMGSLGINNITGGAGANTSQDALMQMLNRNPAAQLGQAGATLDQLSQTGMPANTQSLLAGLQPMQAQQMNQQVNQLRAGASGLGARYGSGIGANEALLRSNLGAQQNATNSQLVYQGQNDAANRMMQAAQGFGGLLNQGVNSQLGAASGINSLMGTQLQGANLGMQGGFNNLNAMNQGGMFNVSSGMQGQQINNQAQQFGNQYLAQLYNQGQQGMIGQMGANNQLAGMMNGIGGPQFNAQGANTLGALGETALDPTMIQMLSRMGQPGTGMQPGGMQMPMTNNLFNGAQFNPMGGGYGAAPGSLFGAPPQLSLGGG